MCASVCAGRREGEGTCLICLCLCQHVHIVVEVTGHRRPMSSSWRMEAADGPVRFVGMR